METADSTPLVSVIIPIYNAAEFLRETLDSVCAQTLREIEIICVDDGSTDGTPDILAEYAARDARFVLLHQQNMLAGAARNYGMTMARGKYISFLDSDDLFAPEMLERMVGAAEKWQADIAHCMGCKYFPETGQTSDLFLMNSNLLSCSDRPICLRQKLGNRIFQSLAAATWNKLYLASFLREHKLTWPDTRYGEDMGFTMFACYLSERSVILRDILIRYRIRSKSLCHDKQRDPAIYFRSCQIFRERLVSCKAEPATMQSLDNHIWENMVNWFISTSDAASLECLRTTFPEYDAAHFHLMQRPAEYFYNLQTYKRGMFFFHPAISIVMTNTPTWCIERKLESVSGMPFYDYEILYAADANDTELMQRLKAQVPKNPHLRIVPSSVGNNLEASCRHKARGHILLHLPNDLKLRAGIAPNLQQLVETQVRGDIPAAPYSIRQTRRELFFRCRSDRFSWCLFGKPIFTVFYTKEGHRKYFLLGIPINAT